MSRGARSGLAVERTVLAWTRTWLAAAVCGLLLLRLTAGSPARIAAVLVLGTAVPVLLTAATGRSRRLRMLARLAAPGPVPPATRAGAVTAATTAVLGLAAAMLVALH